MRPNLNDTIVAISTPVGDGGIGIVRLSGRDSLSIADKIFKSKNGTRPSEFKNYTVHYGHIINRVDKKHETIDEVILTVMRTPKSYTKEDIVEINCHSGIVPLRRVLDLVLSYGARMAEPGEFTKRAFLNGRMDLAQAESVINIIKAKTEDSLRASMSQLEGDLSKKIKALREELLDLLSNIEASIDFPDEDIDPLSQHNINSKITEVSDRLKGLIETSHKGRILSEGIRSVICGRPNVGKSSLMNALLKQRRVIVSHIPGTTRDAIEEMINIDGVPLRLVDTAGIIESDDIVIKEGVERSRLHLNSSDLVLLVLDASKPLTDEDRKLMKEAMGKNTIVVLNKIDLPGRLNKRDIKALLPDKTIVEVSAKDNKNLGELEHAISKMIWGGRVSSDYTALVTSARHKALLVGANEALERASDNLKKNVYPELITIDMREATTALGAITGETIEDDMLDRIFSNFCIGK